MTMDIGKCWACVLYFLPALLRIALQNMNNGFVNGGLITEKMCPVMSEFWNNNIESMCPEAFDSFDIILDILFLS